MFGPQRCAQLHGLDSNGAFIPFQTRPSYSSAANDSALVLTVLNATIARNPP